MIDYIRANNAGTTFGSTGAWSTPVQAPGFAAVCSGNSVLLTELRGHVVRLVIGVGAAGPADPQVITINTAGPALSGGPCVTSDATVGPAYAIVSGISVRDLSGAEFLVDASGWLRAVQRPGSARSWDDPAVLASKIEDIAAHPIQALAASAMHMQM